MSRKTRKTTRDLPKGIYATKSGKFDAKVWPEETKQIHIGRYDTLEEAVFAREKAMKSHHWRGLAPEEHHYGFIYSMVNLRTEQIYFGRRVYKYWNQFSEKRDIAGEWEFYESGSKPVQKMFKEEPHNMRCTILCHTKNNDEASLVEWSLIRAYLLRKLPSGKPMSLNLMLPKLFVKGLAEAEDEVTEMVNKILKELP